MKLRMVLICLMILGFMSVGIASGNEVEQGKSLVEQNSCSACHRQGGVGPALDTLAKGKTDAELKKAILHPKEDFGPSTEMPTFSFNDQQLKAITAYLKSIAK